MPNFLLRLIVATMAFAVPAVAAAEPGPVTDIIAEDVNGQVYVTWTPPAESADVAYYRVYVSRTSILESGGAYDDVERTDGPRPEHILESALPASDLFVSVLAVDSRGNEGNAFVEEAHLVRIGAPDDATVAAPTETMLASPDEPDGTVELLTAQPVSATGVLLIFSEFLSPPPGEATAFFTITDASGSVLRVTGVEFVGATVLLTTEVQIREHVYSIRVADSVGLAGPTELLFTGHAMGREPELIEPPAPAPAPQPEPPAAPVDVKNLETLAPLTKAPDLSDTGTGIALIAAMAGGIVGWRKTRRVSL